MTQYQEKIVGKPGGLVEPGVKQYGIFKKIFKPVKKIAKKVWKSPLGKAAVLGGGLYGLGSLAGGQGGWSNFKALGKMFGEKRLLGQLVRNKEGGLSLGKMALTGLGTLGLTLPFLGDDDDDEQVAETPWETTPASIANITAMAKNRDPSLNFLSPYAQSGFYNAAHGGLARLANGGGVAEAQAEQMLKMQYQKYRNQGGTMSYQQFKMTVLKQAQGQGPMAQEHLQTAQPRMAAKKGGRMGYLFGKKVGVAYSNPNMARSGNLKDNMLNVFSRKFSGRNVASPGRPVATSNSFMGNMIPQAFKDHDADYQAYLASGSELPYQSWKASRVTAAKGGLLSLGGMEKDYRQEGGFVPLGKEEKADDVPARLSKNEFVFTADAVKAAGGGDIDAGAEVMQNMMNNLEEGGEISEESQGAQGMYNQQQMLQSRMA